jgi:hypothetical protein
VRTPPRTTQVDFALPLTRELAEAIYEQGREATVFVMLKLSALAAGQGSDSAASTPSTPSGMVPVYEKPTVSRRARKPGA